VEVSVPSRRSAGPVDFLLTARRDAAVARWFSERAIGQHDVPEKVTIDRAVPTPPFPAKQMDEALHVSCGSDRR